MPTTLSRIKLREAAFFLTGMRARDGTERLDISEEFGYFLSAFLSAARSISFVLHKENPESYDAVRDQWLSSQDPAASALATAMVGHRNEAQKEGLLPARQEIVYVPWLALSAEWPRTFTLIQPWAYDEQATVGVAKFSIDLSTGPEPVVAACERYLEEMRRLIEMFEAT